MKVKVRKPTPSALRGWNLWKDHVHASHVATFLRCWEQFRLTMVEGWQSQKTTEYLEFGSCFHHVLDVCAKLVGKVPSETIIRKAVAEYANKQKEAGSFGVSAQDLERIYGYVEAVAPLYFQRWQLDDQGCKFLFAEEKVSCDFVYPDGRIAKLGGRIDAGFERRPKKAKGRVETWLRDTKTRGEINEQDEVAMLGSNFQFHLYLYHFQQRYGRPADGFVMDIVRRPGLTFKKTETLADHLARVREDIAQRPEHYFVRLDYGITPSDLDRWIEGQLKPIMYLLRLWQDGLEDVSWLPGGRLPQFVNPFGLKVDRRRVDLFGALTTGDFAGLKQSTPHGMTEDK